MAAWEILLPREQHVLRQGTVKKAWGQAEPHELHNPPSFPSPTRFRAHYNG